MDSFLPVWLKKHKPSEDSRFFHYTTLSGLRGILNHRALWCGHISTFNDPLEIKRLNKIQNNLFSLEKLINRKLEGYVSVSDLLKTKVEVPPQLNEAKTIFISGIILLRTTRNYSYIFGERLKEDTHIRIIVIDYQLD